MSRLSRMQVGFGALVLAASVVSLAPTPAWSQPAPAGDWAPPQTPWGDPDIGGVWNSSTVTPLQRPEALADKAFLTAEEAAAIEQRVVDANARANAPSVVRSEPLPVGGNVGGYNAFWLDRGTTVVPTRRTSLVIDPPNGRPARAHARARSACHVARAAAPEGHPGRVGAGRLARAVRLRRPVHLVPRRPVAAHRLQQQLPHRADGRRHRHRAGAHPRRALHPPRRPAGDRRGHQPVRRSLARALGRRHAGRRDHQLRSSGLPVSRPAPAYRAASTGTSARPCGSSSGSPAWGRGRSTTSSRWTIRTSGPAPGPARRRGRRATSPCSSTPATRATTG